VVFIADDVTPAIRHGVRESPPMLVHLRNARVFAPAAVGISDILVADRRILWMGAPGETLPSWLPCAVVDLQGRTVVPALIDLHAHVTGGGGEAGPGSRIPPLHASAFTRSGVGTVVGLLGTDDVTRTTGSLVAWTRELGASGITARCYTGGYHVPPTTLTGSVRGDIAHIDVIVGVGEIAISDHRSSQPTIAELRRLAADAHVGGLMTGKAGILHLHVGDGISGLGPIRHAMEGCEIPARVFHPTHVNRRRALFEEALELTTAGCTIDVTAFPVAADEDAWSAADAVRAYAEAGRPPDQLTVSSDGGGCLPVFDEDGLVIEMGIGQPSVLMETVAELERSGMALPEALLPFTVNPASLLRLERKGRIAPGMDADLVVLDDARRVSDVMLGGRWRFQGEFTARPQLQESS
jgi:beta-aspartyl-dipeptidase (metallo-type)